MLIYKKIIICVVVILLLLLLLYYVAQGSAIKYIPIPTNYTFCLPSLTCGKSIEHNKNRLYKQGAACGLGKISSSLCDNVKQEIVEWKDRANQSMYGDINNKDKKRYDLFMPLNGATLDVVKEMLLSWKENGISLYNPNATIIEVSALITYPGAIGQRIHVDTSDKIHHKDVLSFGVFLHDVDKNLAPLAARPANTWIPWWYSITGEKGDVYGWSAIVQHGGGANHSRDTRYVFYITILYPPLKKVDVGGYSLLPIYNNGIRVKDIV